MTASTVIWADGSTSSVTISWEVTGMKVMNEGSNTKAVVQTYWRKIATDNETGHVVSFEGATPFTSVNVPEGQFIPYEELTEEIVLSWIKVEAEVGQYRDHIDGVLAEKLGEKLKIKHSVERMPWQTDPVTPTPPTPDPAAPAKDTIIYN